MAGRVDDDEVVELRCGGGAYSAELELKRKFDLYCIAVAKSMEAKSQESSLGYSNSQASGTSQLISEASFDGHDDFRGKPANCGTSKEDGSGNFEVETDPSNTKKMRRMLLNRESARRSRKRRETHLSNLESQVSRLTCENASLLKRLADMTQKYKDATVQNRNLIANVETMRTKVNIAEEAARRLTGTTLLLSSTSEIPPGIITLSSCASDLASPSVAIEDRLRHSLPAPLQDDQNKPDLPNVTMAFDQWGDGYHAGLSVMRSMIEEPEEEYG